MKKKILCLLLLASLLFSLSLATFARESVSEVVPFDIVERDNFPEPVPFDIAPECGTIIDGETFAAAVNELYALMADPTWDGTLPRVLEIIQDYHNTQFDDCCHIVFHEDDMTKPDFIISVEWLYFENEPRVYITNSYGVQVSIDDDSLPADIVDIAIYHINTDTAPLKNYLEISASRFDASMASSCQHLNRFRVLRHTTNNGPDAARCWSRREYFTVYCNACRIQVGTSVDSINGPSHDLRLNAQNRWVCSRCLWIRP